MVIVLIALSYSVSSWTPNPALMDAQMKPHKTSTLNTVRFFGVGSHPAQGFNSSITLSRGHHFQSMWPVTRGTAL